MLTTDELQELLEEWLAWLDVATENPSPALESNEVPEEGFRLDNK